jgi:hypothetical protein
LVGASVSLPKQKIFCADLVDHDGFHGSAYLRGLYLAGSFAGSHSA